MEKREDTVLDMDIYRFERNGVRENQFPSKGYVSLQGTFSSISPTLDLTLSGDWVPYLTRGLVFPIPESVAKRGKSPIRLSRKGSGGNSHSHPRGLRMNIASWRLLS
jgi:hypothetical protein